MKNIAIYIINNELRYHCSINYMLPLFSIMTLWNTLVFDVLPSLV